jgi:5-methylcytosine-specific restriction enzyme A
MSKTRRTRGVWDTPRPLGPNGEKLCYNCHGPLPKGKPYNCSEKCSKEWRLRTSPNQVRWELLKRDKGVCAVCGTDTIAIQKLYDKLPKTEAEERAEFLRKYKIPPGRVSTNWWDADHIVPVIEGGGECDLSNYRTLCIPCHKKATKDLHERLKAARNAEPLPQPAEVCACGMTFTVEIHRQGHYEPAEGTLRAWVIQNGQRGLNLLAGRQITILNTAKRTIERALQFKLRTPPNIKWAIDSPGQESAKP